MPWLGPRPQLHINLTYSLSINFSQHLRISVYSLCPSWLCGLVSAGYKAFCLPAEHLTPSPAAPLHFTLVYILNEEVKL